MAKFAKTDEKKRNFKIQKTIRKQSRKKVVTKGRQPRWQPRCNVPNKKGGRHCKRNVVCAGGRCWQHKFQFQIPLDRGGRTRAQLNLRDDNERIGISNNSLSEQR